MNKKLLICTQVVDLDDPILGFFHRLIEEFAKNTLQVHVICLKEGRHSLPSNVQVHSLGKESLTGNRIIKRLHFSIRAWRYAWTLRHEYHAVFVHMNEEYVLLLGVLWRLLGKPIGLERNTTAGSWRSRLAYLLSTYTFYTSPDAHAARALNASRIPNSIDVELYTAPRCPNPSLLFLARIDTYKRLELILAALRMMEKEGKGDTPVLHIYGAPSPGSEQYASSLHTEFADLEASGKAIYHGSVTHDMTPAIYASHDIFVNVTPLGSFDKTLFEAMASGSLVVTSNTAVSGIVRPDLMVADNSVEDLVRAIRRARALPEQERVRETLRMQTYVRENESLDQLISSILGYLYSPVGSSPFPGGSHKDWENKRVLLIQDSASDLDDPHHPLNQLARRGAKVYLLARATNRKLDGFRNHSAVADVILYEGGNSPLALLKFARAHPFDVVALYLKDHYLERHLALAVSFFLWRARKKLVIIEDSEHSLRSISALRFWWEVTGRVSPIVREMARYRSIVALRPLVAFRNHWHKLPPLIPSAIHRILFIRLDHIGDVVQSTALIDPLITRFPDAVIDLLVAPWSAPLFVADSRIRNVIIFAPPWHDRRPASQRSTDPSNYPKNLPELIRILKKEHYDLAIDSRGDFFDSLVAYRSGARITAGTHGFFYNTGMVDNSFLLNYRAEYGNRVIPAVEQHARLARILGCNVPEKIAPHLLWSVEDENAAKVVRDADGSYPGEIRVALHMYSGSNERMWPRAKFTQLINELSIFYGKRIHFFLVGAPDEYESNNQVIKTLPPGIRISNVAGKVLLQQLPAFLSGMDLFVGNDSGPKHIADAVNVPIVAMFILGLSQAHATQNKRSVIFTTKDDTQNIDTIEVSVVAEAVKNLIYNRFAEISETLQT